MSKYQEREVDLEATLDAAGEDGYRTVAGDRNMNITT
jgi:hypothetical protein